MVGSSIGWKVVNAAQCPVLADTVTQSIYPIPEHRVFVVPGLACRNLLDAPDVMRGEETQILGALQLNPSLRKGRHVLCLPGTHTKWVLVADNSIEHFITMPTGEVFSLLHQHSVLVRDARNGVAQSDHDQAAFEQGLHEASNNQAVGLLARLFQCRSRRLTGELTSEATPSFLSGLLIASEVMDAAALMGEEMTVGITIIGAAKLGNLYQQALAKMNKLSTIVSGDDAVLQGLNYVHGLLHQRGEL
jgi:2-dehydro-3-deoxygalactonokinase